MQVTLVKFGVGEQHTLDEGATIGQLLDTQEIGADASIRFQGETIDRATAYQVALQSGQVVVVGPPKVAHGS